MYVCGTTKRDGNDRSLQWLDDLDWVPHAPGLPLRGIEAPHAMVGDGAATAADDEAALVAGWILPLAAAAALVRQALPRLNLTPGWAASEIEVVVGHDFGDVLRVGLLGEGGWVLESGDTTDVPSVPDTHTLMPSAEYYLAELGNAENDPLLGNLHELEGDTVVSEVDLQLGKVFTGRTPLWFKSCETSPGSDWLWSGLMTPVVSQEMGDALLQLASRDIQLIPVLLGTSMEPGYLILNIIATPDCIDEVRSTTEPALPYYLERWPDTIRYQSVLQLAIDPQRTESRHIFRPRWWKQAVVLSREASKILHAYSTPGVRLSPT